VRQLQKLTVKSARATTIGKFLELMAAEQAEFICLRPATSTDEQFAVLIGRGSKMVASICQASDLIGQQVAAARPYASKPNPSD
jgi:hypothetical protein